MESTFFDDTKLVSKDTEYTAKVLLCLESAHNHQKEANFASIIATANNNADITPIANNCHCKEAE